MLIKMFAIWQPTLQILVIGMDACIVVCKYHIGLLWLMKLQKVPPPLFVITTVPAQTLQQFGHQATCN